MWKSLNAFWHFLLNYLEIELGHRFITDFDSCESDTIVNDSAAGAAESGNIFRILS